MGKPERINIKEYDYLLPDDRIARYSLKERSDSKLLVYSSGKISQTTFKQVPLLLKENDRLYFNTTRVVQARIVFYKESGARIEIFCLEPRNPKEYQLAFSSSGSVEFLCLVGNAKKWKQGRLELTVKDTVLYAEVVEREADKYVVRFSWENSNYSFAEILEIFGSTPIPPYLGRQAEKLDATSYQTVYARQNGSVAAPTAGLHFTGELLETLKAKGVQSAELSLHVGAGTFIPVKEENAVDHRMHAELVTVNRDLLISLLSGHRRIAVGTTSTRSLESIYWLGVRAIETECFSFDHVTLDQWDPYGPEKNIPLEPAIATLIEKLDEAGLNSFSFHTRLMITPGYRFRVIGGLFTNFHQPKSTLLLLIAAVVGDDWKKIYNYALENGFRFLSYGDSSLLYV